MKNSQYRYMFYCLISAIITGGIAFGFWLLELGFAIGFSIFLCVLSLGGIVLFWLRSRILTDIVNQKDIISSWKYEEKDAVLVMNEYQNYSRNYIIVGIMFAILIIMIYCVSITIPIQKYNWMLLIVAICTAVNIVLTNMFNKMNPRIRKKVVTKITPDIEHKSYVYVSDKGLIFNGRLYVWKGYGRKIKKVSYRYKDRRLIFTYSYPKPYGEGKTTVFVPVPHDMDGELRKVKEAFKSYYE